MSIEHEHEIRLLFSKLNTMEYEYVSNHKDLNSSIEKIIELKKERDREILESINKISEKYIKEIEHQEKIIISKLKLKIKGE